MRAKKVLAVALSLAMLIGLFPVAGLVSIAEETAPTLGTQELTVYVSDDATGTGESPESPTTLADALTQIAEQDDTYGSGKIVVVDALSIPSGTVLDVGDKALTITSDGETTATLTLNSVVDVTSDLTLGKLKVITNATGGAHTSGFALGGVNFTTTAEFESGFKDAAAVTSNTSTASNGFTIYTGIDANPTAKNTIVLNGGKFASVTLGGNDAKARLNGVDLTVSNTLLKAIYLFSRGGDGATVFNGDVNITFNSGAMMDGDCFHALGKASVMNEGYALNMIKTSSATCTKTALNGLTDATCNLGDHYYYLNIAADGGALTPAGAAKFVVSGAKVANAVGSGIDAAADSSVDGTLTLTTPGVYDVSFVDSKVAKTIYVDATNGDDTLGNGYTSATAWKTLSAAFADADHRESADICVVGTDVYTLDKNTTLPYTLGGLTIRGADSAVRAQFEMKGYINVIGDVKLDNMQLAGQAQFYIMSNEKPITFETGKTFESGFAALSNAGSPKANNGPYVYLGRDGSSPIHATNKAVLRGGHFKDVVVGTTVNNTMAGAEVEIDGANIMYIVLGARNKNVDVTYTKDVNVVLKNGSIQGVDVWNVPEFKSNATLNIAQYSGVTMAKGDGVKNHQMTTLNDGEVEKLSSIPYYKVKNIPADGDITPVAGGEFTVSPAMKATSTDGSATATSADGKLALPAPGVYTGEWLGDPAPLTVYVSQDGNGNGLSAATPTDWDGAFAALKGRESGTIMLVASEGKTLTLPTEIPAVTDGELLITSADKTTPVWVTMAKVNVRNDVTLDNLNVYVAESTDDIGSTHGFRLYGVTFKTTDTFKSGYKAAGETAVFTKSSLNLMMASASGLIEKSTVVLKGGSFRSVLLSDAAATTMGADITIDGATVYTLGLERWKARLIYAGDVNIVLKSGSFAGTGASYGIITRGGSVADGKNVIVNDGVKIDIFRYAAFEDKSGHDDIVLYNEPDTTSLDALMAARRWIEIGAGGTVTPDGEGSFDAIADNNGYRAMLSNETTALRYSEADKLPIPDEAGRYTVEWRKRGGIRTVFVQDGADDANNTGWTVDSPVTFTKALELLQGQESGVIRLVGNATLPAAIGSNAAPVTAGAITVTPAAKLNVTEKTPEAKPLLTMSTAVQVYTDLILDNVKLVQPSASSTSDYSPRFELNGVYFETTEKFESGFLSSATDATANHANAPYIFLRSKNATAAKSTLNLKGGYFNQLYIGGYAVAADMYIDDKNNKPSAEIKGADITVDGAYINYMYTFHRGNGAVKPGFTDDVNIFLKSGTVSQLQAVTKNIVYDNGASLNIFKYETMRYPDNNNYPNILQDYTGNIQGNAFGCPHYFFKSVPSTVTDVIIGDEPGHFTFVGEPTPALETADGMAKTYRGEMVIPTSGVYTLKASAASTVTPPVTEENVKTIYVDPNMEGLSGNSETMDNGFGTIDEAIASLDMTALAAYDRVLIKLINTVETNPITIGTTSGDGHKLYQQNFTKPVTIEGASADTPAYVKINGKVWLRYDITLDNMKVIISKNNNGYNDRLEVFGGSKLTVGENFRSGYCVTDATTGAVSTNATYGGSPDLLAGWNGNGGQGSTIILKGGRFSELIVGGIGGSTTFNKDTHITVDGEDVMINNLLFGNRTAATAEKNVTTFGTDTAPVAVDMLLKRGTIANIRAVTQTKNDGTSCYPTKWLSGSLVRVLQSDKFTLAENAAPSDTIYVSANMPVVTDTPFYKLVVPDELMDAIVPQAAADGAKFDFAAPNKTLSAPRIYDALSVKPENTDGAKYEDGVLTLNQTGVYAVSVYRDPADTGAKDIYVDSELGDDLVGDGIKTNPYKTLTTALNDATGRDGATIYVRGEVTLEKAIPELPGGVTVVGISEFTTETVDGKEKTTETKAVIKITAFIDVNTDLTLDNVKLLAQKSGNDRTGFVINGVEFTTTNTVAAGWDISDPNAGVNENNGPNLFIYSGAKKPVLNIHGGNFASIWPGYSPTSTETGEVTLPGAEINLNTRAASIFIGNRKNRSITFTDDLVITARNSGNIQQMTQLFGNCGGDKNGDIHRKFENGSAIKIYDYTENGFRKGDGVEPLTSITTNIGNLCADCQAGGLDKYHWIHMHVNTQEKDTYYLEETATANTYTIHGGKLGLVNGAANTDGTVEVVNKTLTVTPGQHKALTLVDFDGLPTADITLNNLFLGWKKNGGYVRANNLPTGHSTLTPAFQTVSGELADLFDVAGGQLREDDQALRLMAKMDNTFYETLTASFGEVERGMVLITNAMLGGEELTLEGVYTYKETEYIAAKVVAKNMMLGHSAEMNDGCTYYNATLKGITAANSKLLYGYRGYVTYTDKNGVKHTLYSKDQAATNVWRNIPRDKPEEMTDVYTALVDKINAAGDPSYMYNDNGTQKFNPASLYMSKTSNAKEINEKAEAIRNSVLLSQNVEPGNAYTTYYISGEATASDSNSGTSPTKPLASTNNTTIYSALKTGNCNILFKRGYVYRQTALTIWGSNVFVGAYGEGYKPILVGSDKNYAELDEDDKSYWTLVEGTTDVWKADVTEIMNHKQAEGVLTGNSLSGYTDLYKPDIGAIVFDHGRMMASSGKVMSNDKEAINAFDDLLVQEQLANDFDFWSAIDPDENGKYYVYLKLSSGNPADQFTGIEMIPNKEIVSTRNGEGEYVTVDNLSMKYSSSGIGTSGADHVTITNCEIGYMGGSIMDSASDADGDGVKERMEYQRYGNGITLYNKTDGALVSNNWVYQCYDDAYTNQAENDTQENITVKGNLFEYSLYGMTMWTGKHHSRSDSTQTPEECGTDYLRNITVEDNVMRFAGYGHGTFNRGRFGSSTVGATHLSVGSGYSWLQNVVIKNNYFDTSYRHLVRATYYPGADEYVFIGNTWNQNVYTRSNDLADVLGTTSMVARVTAGSVYADGVDYTCATENEMYTSVRCIDVAPGEIYFDGKMINATPGTN